MRVFIVLAVLCLFSIRISAQDFQAGLRRVAAKEDTVAARKILAQWAQQKPQDPDLYVAKFNYWLRAAERVEVRQGAASSNGFSVNDNAGQAVGSLNPAYDVQAMSKARAVLQQGIALAPDRLDMRFGLAKTYEMTGDGPQQIVVLQKALADRVQTNRPWKWRAGAALPESEATFVPKVLEEYATSFWLLDTSEAQALGKQVAELLQQYYPTSSLGYFNLGLYHSFQEEYAQALPLFEKADKLRPNDTQTVLNLLRLTVNLGKKKEAQEYLARLRKLPNTQKEAANFTREIREMK